jgi:glycosyltransferase involved in cell wall biosynthesis
MMLLKKNNKPEKISVLITAHAPYVKYLERVVAAFTSQSLPPFEIIVFVNGVDKEPTVKFPLSSYIQLHIHKGKLNAAAARNKGAKLCAGDVVVFFDADDLPSKYKIEFTSHIFCTYSPDLFIHNYHYRKPCVFMNERKRSFHEIKIIHDIKIAPSSTNVIADRFPVHHAHVAVKKEVWCEIHYDERPRYNRREDGKFCQDVVAAEKRVVFADYKLVSYL